MEGWMNEQTYLIINSLQPIKSTFDTLGNFDDISKFSNLSNVIIFFDTNFSRLTWKLQKKENLQYKWKRNVRYPFMKNWCASSSLDLSDSTLFMGGKYWLTQIYDLHVEKRPASVLNVFHFGLQGFNIRRPHVLSRVYSKSWKKGKNGLPLFDLTFYQISFIESRVASLFSIWCSISKAIFWQHWNWL